LYGASPLKPEVIERTDLLVVRELTGGIYFGEKTRTADQASDACVYTRAEIERIARIAFEAARSRVTSVDKANVLETSRLWREVVGDVHSREFPNIELEHLLVDNAAMRLVAAPRHFDVLLTENMFGDILSDEAAEIAGSLGLAASLNTGAAHALAQAQHGSAPDLAGQDLANPASLIGSAAMLLEWIGERRHEHRLVRAARGIDAALERTIAAPAWRTRDLGGSLGTKAFGAQVATQLQAE
jgi:3-isopropylmalate dehydrogenase